jgi:2-polyprenyl-6-hydroxyphenyl methylase/3-demethylubiquinone-9 3-methyltransferase
MGRSSLKGLSFLDVGSGSGIHSLAALKLGCARLLAVDIDDVSVATTRRTLSFHAPDGRWECYRASVFDLDPKVVGAFDVVYSWGVLHHTGSLIEAMTRALHCLKQDGLAVFALYRKTPCCGLWTAEKRWYAQAPSWAQAFAYGTYVALFCAGLLFTLRSPRRYIEDYPQRNRGMDFHRDVHDWLGGYPYESLSYEQMKSFMAAHGLAEERAFVRPPGLGLFGTGNNEYVFRKCA